MIVEFPLRYQMRFQSGNKKTAQLRNFEEPYFLEILEVEEGLAPVVGKLTTETVDIPQGAYINSDLIPQQRVEIEYRAARLANEKVSLIAPVSSAAFQLNALRENREITTGIETTSIIKTPISWPHHNPRAAEVGTIFASSRDREIENLHRVTKSMAIIQGSLWSAAKPPGWQASKKDWRLEDDLVNNWVITAIPDPLEKRSEFFSYGQSNYNFVCNHQNWKQSFGQALGFREIDRFEITGNIEETISGCLQDDWLWIRFRRVLGEVLLNAKAELIGEMMLEEQENFKILKLAFANWPNQRSNSIINRTVSFSRSLHATKNLGMVENIELVKQYTGMLKQSFQPTSLEQKLAEHGIDLNGESFVLKI